jgi:hypothetical protein
VVNRVWIGSEEAKAVVNRVWIGNAVVVNVAGKTVAAERKGVAVSH